MWLFCFLPLIINLPFTYHKICCVLLMLWHLCTIWLKKDYPLSIANFIFWLRWRYWVLNLRPQTCQAGAVCPESCLQLFLLQVIFWTGFTLCFPGLASDYDLPMCASYIALITNKYHYVQHFCWDGGLLNSFCLDWFQTAVFPISASWISEISDQHHYAWCQFLKTVKIYLRAQLSYVSHPLPYLSLTH
jgi:hypothetical protein